MNRSITPNLHVKNGPPSSFLHPQSFRDGPTRSRPSPSVSFPPTREVRRPRPLDPLFSFDHVLLTEDSFSPLPFP